MSGNKQSAPLPRDHDEPTFSEMMPFRSKKIRLFKSPIFYFVAVTAIFNVVLFGLRMQVVNGQNAATKVGAFNLLVQIALFYLLAVSLLAFHSYAKTDKPITYYIFPCLVVYFFMNSPLWSLIYVPFDTLAGGNLMETSPDFPVRIWSGVVGPGLREELVKGLPALIGAAMTMWAMKFNWMPRRLYELLRVRSPLDGVLMGFAAGCTFIFYETSGQYIGNALQSSFKASHGNLSGAFGDALMLLLPRAMNGWVGHMAWAGTFGYFIGLAVIRPRRAWQLVLIGWLIAGIPHGLWDSSPPGGPTALYFIGGFGGLLAIACLVKARQLEASMFGRSTETFGSIVVGASPPVMAKPAVAPQVPLRPTPNQPASSPPPATPQMAAVASAGVSAAQLMLAIENLRLPLRSGGILDLSNEPSLSGRGQGVKAEVTRHPTNHDVLGLKNLGTATWYARLRDDTIRSVEAQRSLRIAAGVSIDFGGGLVAQIVAD